MPPDERKSWRQQSLAKNRRVLVFCLLEGLALALPVGAFLIPEKVRETIPAPDGLRMMVLFVCLGSLFVLPIWTAMVLGYRHPLFWFGILTFLLLLASALLPVT